VDGKRETVPISQVLEEVELTPGGRKAASHAAKGFQSGLELVGRVWSVGIIGLSLMQPAALVAYWVCSISYTLVQNMVFAYIDDSRRAAQIKAKSP
jgi:hypothetical protein